MAREWRTVEENMVEVDPRHLKMQSLQAIRSVVEALVELITNSDDAYGSDDKGKIIITVTRERSDRTGVIAVKDRAGGMTLDEMKQKILKYGAFSASEHSRGFMGRGAKDIVALGRASFESVKEGLLCRVELDGDFRFSLKKPLRACDADYERLGVRPGMGGMEVTLEVSKQHNVPRHDTLVRDLQRHFALRDILQRREVRLIDGRTAEQVPLRYSAPEGTLFCDETMRFEPPYEGATAKFRLFKSATELPSELQEGIIVTDGLAIYQVTRFSSDLEEDRIARHFFGRLECSYVRQLQLEFEARRGSGEDPLLHNPVDIVDPNRRRGLDREAHPFVEQLFASAERRLRAAVEEVRKVEGERETRIASEETNRRLKALSKAIAEHLQSRIEEETLLPRTKEQEAELQKEGVLLNPQFNQIAIGETRRLGYTVLSLGEGEDPDHVSVSVEGEGIRVDPVKPLLRHQRRNTERLSAYFEISGIGPVGPVVLTVAHSSEIIGPIARKLQIVKPRDQYAGLPDGLSFEKRNYTVHDNGLRTLGFVAKGGRFGCVNWEARDLILSSNPTAVTILRGSALTVKPAGKDIWHGEAQVRGRGIGKSSTIALSVSSAGQTESANTSVTVVGKEEPAGVSIEVQLVPDPGGQWRAQWDRENPNILKVFAEHPTLARYLGPRQDNYPGQAQPHFRVLLAEIVADKVVQRILENRAQANPSLFADSQKFFFLYSEEMTSFLPIAHKIMLSDRDVARISQE